MKRFAIVMIMSMVMLVGCTNPNTSVSQIKERDQKTLWQGLTYDSEQENVILFSDLEQEFENNNMNLIKDAHPDALKEQYNLENDRLSITILVKTLASTDQQFVTEIFMEPRNNYMLLSEHPVVKIIADVMEEEGLLTWVAEREGKMTPAGKSNENIQDVLAMGRCYLSFDYWSSGRDMKRLEFKWALKPHISKQFENIARRLEDQGMLTTGYIEGPGGETLIATNSDYYALKKRGYSREKKAPSNIDQAAAYQVMHDKNKPDNYSVQLHGYMRDDPAYPTQVGAMPGLDKITQLMNMGQGELLAVTDEINKELTEAKKIRNKSFNGEYYLEGEVGEYRYAITVPQGIVVYNFTVLIEKI